MPRERSRQRTDEHEDVVGADAADHKEANKEQKREPLRHAGLVDRVGQEEAQEHVQHPERAHEARLSVQQQVEVDQQKAQPAHPEVIRHLVVFHHAPDDIPPQRDNRQVCVAIGRLSHIPPSLPEPLLVLIWILLRREA